jgi:nitroimidazol reductase NimA-like FMN-containing flavoprotein (pyridoxamine 5'-phosphate oxidase superfamily)
MQGMSFEPGLAHLNREECMTLLAGSSFGRVGVSVDALPAILPVTIALVGEGVVFRTVPGTKLAYAARNAVLAVEADDYDSTSREGWSVLVRGVARQLEDDEEIALARSNLDRSWIPEPVNEHFVRVACDLVTGRRLAGDGGHDLASTEGRTP